MSDTPIKKGRIELVKETLHIKDNTTERPNIAELIRKAKTEKENQSKTEQ